METRTEWEYVKSFHHPNIILFRWFPKCWRLYGHHAEIVLRIAREGPWSPGIAFPEPGGRCRINHGQIAPVASLLDAKGYGWGAYQAGDIVYVPENYKTGANIHSNR